MCFVVKPGAVAFNFYDATRVTFCSSSALKLIAKNSIFATTLAPSMH